MVEYETKIATPASEPVTQVEKPEIEERRGKYRVRIAVRLLKFDTKAEAEKALDQANHLFQPHGWQRWDMARQGLNAKSLLP